MEILAMLGVGDGMHFVAVGLSRLRQENERRGIGDLQAEGEVEQDEGIDVEVGQAGDVEGDPDADEDRLHDEKERRAEEAGEGLRLDREPIVAEDGAEMQMRPMKAIE